MDGVIHKINFPEIFIGLVAPIGVSFSSTIGIFEEYFKASKYSVEIIKVTDIFDILNKYIPAIEELNNQSEFERYKTYIKYGDQLREHFSDDAILAKSIIARILKRRTMLNQDPPFSKTVYILHQFKRKEEIALLRSIYGRLFFQVSVYSRRGARVDMLSRKFAHSDASFSTQNYRGKAEELIQIDENEKEDKHGQRVGHVFHDADFIINADAEIAIESQVRRFGELLFSSNCISPTRAEYGMFLAKAAALRTLDLSRQVGAAIFAASGEIIALGSNEVPRAGGGTYWADDRFDDRDYVRGQDTNEQRKRENVTNLLKLLGKSPAEIDTALAEEPIIDSQIMDALEYGRVIHAEMSALTDAARIGVAVRGGTLYCTTFPCHMCAKHIVAAGISKVIFLEPYPKSLAIDLHSDSIQVEGGERGRNQNFPAVNFEHFFGISPRRYRDLFERGRRKDKMGHFQQYIDGIKRPNIDYKNPFYNAMETLILQGNPQEISMAVAEANA